MSRNPIVATSNYLSPHLWMLAVMNQLRIRTTQIPQSSYAQQQRTRWTDCTDATYQLEHDHEQNKIWSESDREWVPPLQNAFNFSPSPHTASCPTNSLAPHARTLSRSWSSNTNELCLNTFKISKRNKLCLAMPCVACLSERAHRERESASGERIHVCIYMPPAQSVCKEIVLIEIIVCLPAWCSLHTLSRLKWPVPKLFPKLAVKTRTRSLFTETWQLEKRKAEQELLELNLATHCNTQIGTHCTTLQYAEQGLLELNLRQKFIGDAGAKVSSVCFRALLRICRPLLRECGVLL